MIPEKEFYKKMAESKSIRLSVRAIVIDAKHILVQKSINPEKNTESPFFVFPGGGLELYELMEERINKEFEEEFHQSILSATYLFVVENFFFFDNQPLHSLEHYFLVKLDNVQEIKTYEPYITHNWLPIDKLDEYDLRPHIVSDIIHKGNWNQVKHLIDRK